MNARIKTAQPETLRDQIARHLDKHPESTLKDIAKAVGKILYPSIVTKLLNSMRTDGDIECEQQKGEMRYWLAKPLLAVLGAPTVQPEPAPAGSLPAGINPGTRAAQIWGALNDRPATVDDISRALKQPNSCIAPALTVMAKYGHATRIRGEDRIYRYTRPAPNAAQNGIQPQPEVGNNTGSDGSAKVPCSAEAVAVPQPAPAAATPSAAPVAEDVTPLPARLVQSAEQSAAEIDTRLEAAVEVTRLTTLVRTLEAKLAERTLERNFANSDAAAAEQKRLAAVAELTKSMQDLDRIHELLAPFSGDIDASDLTEVQLAEKAASMWSPPITGDGTGMPLAPICEEAVDVLDAAKGYIVRAPKRRLRFISKPQRAREAAIAAARAGATKADVYALVYVGSAERSTAWKEAS